MLKLCKLGLVLAITISMVQMTASGGQRGSRAAGSRIRSSFNPHPGGRSYDHRARLSFGMPRAREIRPVRLRSRSVGSESLHNYSPIRRSQASHIYVTGLRGGCYYINGNGNKTHVARSFCR